MEPEKGWWAMASECEAGLAMLSGRDDTPQTASEIPVGNCFGTARRHLPSRGWIAKKSGRKRAGVFSDVSKLLNFMNTRKPVREGL